MTGSHDPLADLGALEPVPPSAEISAAIHQHCTENLQPARGMSTALRLSLSFLFAIGGVCVLSWSVISGMSAGAGQAAILGAAGWSVVMAAILLLGFGRPPGRRVSRRLRLGLGIGLPLVFLVYLGMEATHVISISELSSSAHGAFDCGLHAFACGSVVSAGVLFAWRGTDPMTPGISGALVGLLGGLAGAVGVGVACPTQEGWHLWLGHGLTVAVLALVGWLAGRRWLVP